MTTPHKLRSDSLLASLSPDQQADLLTRLDQQSYEEVTRWLGPLIGN